MLHGWSSACLATCSDRCDLWAKPRLIVASLLGMTPMPRPVPDSFGLLTRELATRAFPSTALSDFVVARIWSPALPLPSAGS